MPREAARPSPGADIEASVPGGREVRGKLHVQPSAAHSPRDLAGERQARKYTLDMSSVMAVTDVLFGQAYIMEGDIAISVCAVLSTEPRSCLDQVIMVQWLSLSPFSK